MGNGDGSVAVLVVTYNSVPVLPELIASLPAGLGELDWHLVVVDNDSSDGSAELAARLAPDAVVVRTGRNAGYAAGINAALASAGRFSWALVLNPDVRLLPGCVPVLVSTLERHGAGIAVPLLQDARGRRINSMRREPTLLRLAADAVLGAQRAGRIGRLGEQISDDASYAREGPVDWAEGSTLLISAACLDRVGPWDESYFLYSEETDFALRAREAGFATWFTPAARAVHLEGGSAHNPQLWALVVANKLRLQRRRHGLLSALAFWCLLVLREGSRALLGRPTSRAAVRLLFDPRRLRQAPGPHSLARRRNDDPVGEPVARAPVSAVLGDTR